MKSSSAQASSEFTAHADALLDSLFADDLWDAEPAHADDAAFDSPAIPASVPQSGSLIEATANPPAVNPSGPARREPFSRSPRAPSASERKPMVISGAARSHVSSESIESALEQSTREQSALDPTAAAQLLPELANLDVQEATLASVQLDHSPLPTASEPSPMEPALVLTPGSAARPMASADAASPQPPLAHDFPAHAWLNAARAADERASWLEREAVLRADPRQQGQCFLYASELWAIANSPAKALSAARQASALLPESLLAQRQARQLCLAQGDMANAAQALDREIALCNHEQRAQLLVLRAELCRTQLADAEGFRNAMVELESVDPSDPRPALYRFAQELSSDWGSSSGDNEADLLAEARRQVRQYREAADSTTVPLSLTFERSRRALRTGDARRAARAVLDLQRLEPLRPAALWLAAALFGSAENEQDNSGKILQQIHDQWPSHLASRARARLSLQTNDTTHVQAAWEVDPQAFSPLERLGLSVLSNSSAPSASLLASLPEASLSELNSTTLRAARGVWGLIDNSLLLRADPTEQRLDPLDLGRALVGAPESPELSERLRANSAHDTLAFALSLELAHHASNTAQVVQALSRLPEGWGPEHEKSIAPLLCAALIAELGGDPSQCQALCREVLRRDPSCEAAHRMLSELSHDSDAPAIETLARSSQNPERAALLMLEAAAAVGVQSPAEFHRLLSSSVERCAALPFAYRWAEQLGRAGGDTGLLLDWLERGRATTHEPAQHAIAAIQAALLIQHSDPPQAAQLIAEAAAAFPNDLSLQELGERIAGAAWGDGGWREIVAAKLPDPAARSRLLLEAAILAGRTDTSSATKLAQAALLLDSGSPFAVGLHQHFADQSAAPDWLSLLGSQLEGETDLRAQREGRQRLAALWQRNGNWAEAKRCWQALLDADTESLPALRGLEHLQITTDALTELASTETHLALLLEGPESIAHALLSLRANSAQGTLADAGEILGSLLADEAPPISIVHAAHALARLTEDAGSELNTTQILLDRATHQEDRATLALRAAMLQLKLDDPERAGALLELSLAAVPDHLVALSAQAQLHKSQQRWAQAAQSLSAFAAASRVSEHQVQALLEAGLIWLDRLGDAERGEAALEQAAHLDPGCDAAVERLEQHYTDTQQRVKLVELLDLRLADTPHEQERSRLQAVRAAALSEMGVTPRPRQASHKLDASPEHRDALEAFARRAALDGDLKAAETSWLQLIRIVHEPEKQAEYYRGLATLYASGDANLERAAVCYGELKKRLPNDIAATESLIAICEKLGRGEQAIELQTDLLKGARDDAERRRWTIRLAQLYHSSAKDHEHAELTLQQARKTWPHNAEILRALAELYRSTGQQAALSLLLDRVSKEARNLLTGGTMDPAAFEILSCVAELGKHADMAKVVHATRAAILGGSAAPGSSTSLAGAGAAAGSQLVEKFLMPETLSPALRTLLDEAGQALDRATAPELSSLHAVPLHEQDVQLADYCQSLSQAFGLGNVTLLVGPEAGLEAVPLSSSPPQVLLGQALIDPGNRQLLLFCLYKALKAVAAHACATQRGTPADIQLRVSSFLCCFVPDWQPPGLERTLVEPLCSRIAGVLRPVSPEVTMLAREVVQTFGTRPALVGSLVERWVTRTALLAVGDPAIALLGIAGAITGKAELPADLSERARWIAKTPLARDLMLFSISDEYAAARRQLGLVDPGPPKG